MTMQLDPNTSLQSANLSARIPVRSSNDFTLSFALVIPELKDQERRDEIANRLQQSLPFLQVSTYGDDKSAISCAVADDDKAGICKHTLKMFQDAGVHVSSMGMTNFQQPPYLDDALPPAELPYSFTSFAAFKELVCGTVNTVLNGVKVSAPSTTKPGIG